MRKGGNGMKKRCILTLLILCITLSSLTAFAENTYSSNYIYNYWGDANKSISAFELSFVIDSSAIEKAGRDIPLKTMEDVFVAYSDLYGCNAIYTVDKETSRLNIFSETGEFLDSIKIIRNDEGKIVVKNGKQLILTNPEGVFVTDDEIFIADTGASRVVVLKKDKYTLSRIIEKPDNMIGSTLFEPSKVAVDNAGRIFLVVQGSTEGIIELNPDGSFSRYFGVNSPRVNLVDIFWRSFASEAQKQKMSKIYAPSFNNVMCDNEGFIYAVTNDASAQHMVFRLNAKGENVLREMGYSEVQGDIFRGNMADTTRSSFVDIAVSDYGVYAVVDSTMGRVFVYNFDGNLLNVFGGLGNSKGNFKTPSGITWLGDSLIVTDSSLACAFVFTPTEFGELILEAEKKYYNGDFDGSAELMRKVLEKNANYDIAYVQIGKNLLMQDKYEEAMKYLKLGGDRTYYSKAYNGYRNIQIQNNFIWIALVFVAFLFYIFYSEYRYHRKNRE